MDTKTYLQKIKSQIRELSPEKAYDLLQKAPETLVVDLREDHEIENMTLPKAQTITKGFLELKICDLAPQPNQKILLYCAGGNRSALAAKSLQDMGYQNVFSLDGGFRAWKEADLPLEKKIRLTGREKKQFARHLSLPEIGEQGQKKLLRTKVAIVGIGGLGCPAALYLTAAGIGTLGLIDHDVVEISNLQRQILYGVNSVGELKVDCAKERLLDLNPLITVQTHNLKLNQENAEEILKNYDIILNGCDNFSTRYSVNDACIKLGKFLVDGSVQKFSGQVTVFPPGGPCYRCLFPSPPPQGLSPNCAEQGVFGALPGWIGTLQAIEVIKLATGVGEPLIGKLLRFETLTDESKIFSFKKNPNCPICNVGVIPCHHPLKGENTVSPLQNRK